MPTSFKRLVALLLLLTGIGAAGQSYGPDNANEPKKEHLNDRYGDPLPEGAIGRLGTVRFRHGFQTGAVAFSPDGKYLASGGRFPGLCLWDAKTGRLVSRPSIYGATSVAFSPDSKTLLASSGRTMLFDVPSGTEVRRFQSQVGHDFVAFSPDGKMVAAEEREQIVFLSVASRKRLGQLLGHTAQINCLAFSPMGKTLATGSKDKTIRLWDVVNRTELHRIEAKDEVNAIAFSPNGKQLAWVGDDDPTIRLWDLIAKQTTKLLKGLRGPVFSIGFSPDGMLLAAGGYDGKIFLWDPTTGKELRRWQANEPFVAHIAFSPDSNTLASTGRSAIRLWETASGKEIHRVAGHSGVVQALQFSADGKTLHSLGMDQRAITWNVATRTEEGSRLPAPIGPPAKLWQRAALFPDGKVLAVGALFNPKEKLDGTIRLIDTGTGKQLHALDKHRDHVAALAFSDDGKILASGGKNGIFLWDPKTARQLDQIKGHQAEVRAMTFSPNGKMLASAGEDRKVRLWNVATAKEIRHWESHLQNRFVKPAFSTDSKLLASSDDSIRVWEVPTGREIMQFPLPQEAFPTALTFSPTGRFLATCQFDFRIPRTGDPVHRIILWELLSGKEARRIERNEESVWSLAFHPNGRILASGGGDTAILLWDMTGRLKDSRLRPANFSAKELNSLWLDLGAEASKAHPTIWRLAAAPSQTVSFFEKKLKPVQAADTERIGRLIAELDSKQFDVRSRAFNELAKLGELAGPALMEAKPAQPSNEFRRRVDLLLARLNGPETDPQRLRSLRAMEVLENIGSPEARKLLKWLATGTPAARLTREAQASLQRLNRP